MQLHPPVALLTGSQAASRFVEADSGAGLEASQRCVEREARQRSRPPGMGKRTSPPAPARRRAAGTRRRAGARSGAVTTPLRRRPRCGTAHVPSSMAGTSQARRPAPLKMQPSSRAGRWVRLVPPARRKPSPSLQPPDRSPAAPARPSSAVRPWRRSASTAPHCRPGGASRLRRAGPGRQRCWRGTGRAHHRRDRR